MSFIINLIKTNYERELNEKKIINVSFNRVFLESLNTRKTIIAKLYNRILIDIRMLNNDESKIIFNIKTLYLLILNVKLLLRIHPISLVM